MEAIGVSELIARIVGPVHVTIPFSLMARPDTYRKIIAQLVEQEALSDLGGILALALGVAILTFHFVWRTYWTVLLTILGCMAAAKGAALVIAPNWLLRTYTPLLRAPSLMRAGGVAAFALGLLLAAKGYGRI